MTDEQALKAIAHNLRKYRGERSLAEISRQLGTFPASIARIERGEHMPGVGFLTRLAAALGVSVEAMLVLPTRREMQQSA